MRFYARFMPEVNDVGCGMAEKLREKENMTYDELIILYPMVDLFLELFKGLAPTIVAILAIVVNNALSKKREQWAIL